MKKRIIIFFVGVFMALLIIIGTMMMSNESKLYVTDFADKEMGELILINVVLCQDLVQNKMRGSAS